MYTLIHTHLSASACFPLPLHNQLMRHPLGSQITCLETMRLKSETTHLEEKQHNKSVALLIIIIAFGARRVITLSYMPNMIL